MTTASTWRRRGTGRDPRFERTTRLLAELGDVRALAMRAVAASSGVIAPSVYRQFPDKDTLERR